MSTYCEILVNDILRTVYDYIRISEFYNKKVSMLAPKLLSRGKPQEWVFHQVSLAGPNLIIGYDNEMANSLRLDQQWFCDSSRTRPIIFTSQYMWPRLNPELVWNRDCHWWAKTFIRTWHAVKILNQVLDGCNSYLNQQHTHINPKSICSVFGDGVIYI